MRRLIATMAFFFAAVSTFGQGTIIFNNRIGNIDAPVSVWDGTGPGVGWQAQLYHVTGGVFHPLEPATTFRTTSPAAEYYVVQPATSVIVPGVGAGEQATIVMRAWKGQSYDTGFFRGDSVPITISLGGIPAVGAPIPDATLIGLEGFNLILPEPSTLSLGILGAAALLFRRRG